MKTKKDKMFTLGDFLEEERKKRKLSIREFAKLIGVSHSTLNKHIKKPETRPSLDLLERLSDKTGASLHVLIMLASPALAKQSTLSSRALLFAEEFDKLGEELQNFFLSAALTQKGKGGSKK